jgi:hypothetical protein
MMANENPKTVRSTTVYVACSEIAFCKWLDAHIAAVNKDWTPKRLQGRVIYWQLEPPEWLDMINQPAPRILNIRMVQMYKDDGRDSYSFSEFDLIPRPPEISSPRLALSIEITEAENGLQLKIDHYTPRRVVGMSIGLEDFVQALEELSPVTVGEREKTAGSQRGRSDGPQQGQQAAPGPPQRAQESLRGNEYLEPEVNDVLRNVGQMKKHYKYYNPATALLILKAIPDAWNDHIHDGGRWGPGVIGSHSNVNSTTVGRYLKAFRSVGLEEWEGVRLP